MNEIKGNERNGFGDLENDVHLNLSYRTLNIKSHGSFGGLSFAAGGRG